MRLRILFATSAPALLALAGCTSDLPAPYDYEVVEPPPPPNELQLDCETIPLTANSAQFSYTLGLTGTIDGTNYTYSAENLPAGLEIDAGTGAISGVVTADAGDYTFSVIVEDAADPDNYSARTECSLTVNPKITAPLDINTVPYCLQAGDDLRDLVVPGTGDGTPITCAFSGGNGNGRMPNGITVDEQACTITGSIAEDRLGTWVFAVRGTQSGASVYVPYCVTNDEAQGYEISAVHSGDTDALRPIMRTYDPTISFDVGGDMDPRYTILAPGICGTSCFYRYSFLRTNAPIDNSSFTLEPDGLVQDETTMEPIGFFHELRVGGPAVPEEFRDRPWILSSAVSYCITDSDTGCTDPAAQGDAAFEFALVMVPDPG